MQGNRVTKVAHRRARGGCAQQGVREETKEKAKEKTKEEAKEETKRTRQPLCGRRMGHGYKPERPELAGALKGAAATQGSRAHGTNARGWHHDEQVYVAR